MKPFLLIAFLFTCSHAFAQTGSGGPLLSKGERIYLNGQRLKHHEIIDLYHDHPEALSKYKSARLVRGINYVPAFAGGFCLGWGLAELLSTGTTDGGVLAVGGGLIATVVVLQVVTNNKIKKSVELYNGTKTATLHLEYGVMGSGIGVGVRF